MFYKYGYCKFKTNCKNKHVTQVCDDEKCSQTKCHKRHPRMCRFFFNFGTCKLGNLCAYKHDKNNEFEKLEKKMNDVLRRSMEKDNLIKDLVEDVKKLIQKNEEKDDKIQKLVKEVIELKEKAIKSQEEEDDVEKEETTGNEDVDAFVKFSKKSVKLLNSMETDLKKSRKVETMKKKFKNHKAKIEVEAYSSICKTGLPPHLGDILNCWMDDSPRPDMTDKEYRENIDVVMKKCRKEFYSFLSDPVKLSPWY